MRQSIVKLSKNKTEILMSKQIKKKKLKKNKLMNAKKILIDYDFM